MLYDETLRAMTQEDHADLTSGGCDPHCHACGTAIIVGDMYGFKEFIAAGFTVGGIVMSGEIRGTACADCINRGRDLPTTERADLEHRLQASLAATASSTAPKTAPAMRPGCFVLPDGTRL